MAVTPTVRINASFFDAPPQENQPKQESTTKTAPAGVPATRPAATDATTMTPVAPARRGESVLSTVQKSETNVKIICSLLKTLSPIVGGDLDNMIERIDIAEAIVAKAIEKMGIKNEDEITRMMPLLLPAVISMVARNSVTEESIERLASGLAYAGTKIPAGSRLEQYTASSIDAIELRRSAMVSITPVIAEMGSFRFNSHEKDDLEMAVKHITAAMMHHLPDLAPDGVGEMSTVILAQSMMNNFGIIMAGAWRKNTFDALDMVDDIVITKKIPMAEAMDQARAHCDWSKKIRDDFNSMAEKLVSLTKEIVVLDFQKPARVSTKIRKRIGAPA